MELKRFFALIILSTLVCFILPHANAQKVKRVVIDAGHGGHDPGAVGKSSKEKDITLSIALKTGKFIEENLSDVQVIYTRNTDVFVELYRRAKIANEANADLFISIHCNANKSTTPYGAETYVMGLHKSEANLAVAQLENSSILLEDDYHAKYEGFDPNSPEGYIFFSMLQNAYLSQSLNLASIVQKHFKDRVNLFDRGVKQAGFLVLYKTTMPSVLIETGFISNAKEEKILASQEGQTYIASAIFRAVKDYKASVERTEPQLAQNEPDSKPVAHNPEPADVHTINVTDVPVSVSTETEGDNQSKPSDQAIVFKVQFLISKSPLKTSNAEFKGLKDVSFYIHNGMYKYTYGNERTFDAANQLVKKLRSLGFKDCFVVAFQNDERIDVEKAKGILN